MSSIKQIFSGFNYFFALSENKGIFGWGDNSQGQVSALATRGNVSTPQSLRLNFGST